MKINVIVKTNAKKEEVEELSDGSYRVCVHVLPIKGKANQRVIELLANHMKLPKSQFHLIKGMKSKKKTFEVQKSGSYDREQKRAPKLNIGNR
ncbi:MAG: DUF167 domain-containing protein [Bdellovibrionota bacterium]